MVRLLSSPLAAHTCALILRASLVWAAPASLAVVGRTESDLPAASEGPSTAVRLSYSMGLVSIACWMIPGVAQLWQNYKCKSGDGIAIGFVLLWLAGDLLNGVGAWLQGLLATQIALAAYYVAGDAVLLAQVYYYGKIYPKRTAQAPAHANESRPFLQPPESSDYGAVNASAVSAASVSRLSLPAAETKSDVAKYALAGFALTILGIFTYCTAPAAQDVGDGPSSGAEINWPAQLYGWTSALLYISSPVPQLFKNRETKCVGLSVALFIFAAIGNLTQVISIVAYRPTDAGYLLANSSWIAGSAVPIIFDLAILGQYVSYAPARRALQASGVGQQRRRSIGLDNSGRRLSYTG